MEASIRLGEDNAQISPFSPPSRWERVALWCFVGLVLSSASVTGWFFWYMHQDPPPFVEHAPLPKVQQVGQQIVIRMPNGNLVGLVGTYPDELTAYLRFQYLRGLKKLAGSPILMTVDEKPSGPQYLLYVVLDNDLLSQSERLAELQINGHISSFQTDSPPASVIHDWERQTRIFEAAYQQPVRKRLMQLPRPALTSAVARFILFKTRTDRRVRTHLEPAAGKALSADDARDFAADMIDVAKFYDIPLDMLLGIGAMENNYLDIRGDLRHAIWKKHTHRGDIILKRRGNKVLVSNYSQGPWQITRETLRYVHSLYLHDKRDYSALPERLRPPKTLNLDQVNTHVLTTYAGLLLRKLLDYFNGDVVKAQGAYNGGPGRPNLRYSEGVSMVSDYAHRVISMAAGRKGNSVAETPLTVAKQRTPELMVTHTKGG